MAIYAVAKLEDDLVNGRVFLYDDQANTFTALTGVRPKGELLELIEGYMMAEQDANHLASKTPLVQEGYGLFSS